MANSISKFPKGYEVLNLNPDQIFTFPEGIPGFERIKQYCLLFKEEERPFFHLTALGGFNLEFIVVNPWLILPDYKPEISDADIEYLGQPKEKELIMLAIVVLKEPIEESTVNLAAPIIINTKTGFGRQIVIRNFKDYSNQYPLFPKETTPEKQLVL